MGELLYELKGKIEPVVVGNTPEGLRMDVRFEAELVSGKVRGRGRGIDYLAIRPDGVAILDIHMRIITDEGHPVAVKSTGISTRREKEYLFSARGSSTFQTPAEELKWLNSTFAVWEEWADTETRELYLRAYEWKGL